MGVIKDMQKTRRRLTPEEKADIALSREARNITKKTNKDIADEVGVSEYTVRHINKDNLSPEAKKIYNKKRERLASLAVDVTSEALTKSLELISIADSPRDLSGVAAAGKFADSVYRLETQQPTDIRTMSALEHATAFYTFILEKVGGKKDIALDCLIRANLEPLVTESQRMEAVKFLSTGK